MHIQPLQNKMVVVILLAIVAYFAAQGVPSVSNPILTILIKGTIISTVYGSGVVYFKISEDVNKAFDKWFKKG